MRLTKTILALIACLLLGAVAVGCGDDDDDDGGNGGTEQAQEVDTLRPGTLVVGSDIPFPPFESGRPPDYDGFDIDLVNEIATRLDLDLEVSDTPFDTIFRDLAQEKFDLVASATTITPKREQRVDFSDPYYNAEQSILVQEDSDIETVEDLAGQTVGVQKGTTGEAYAKENANAGDLRSYGETDDAFNALVAGQVDAVIHDLPATQDAAANKEGLAVATSIPTDESYGFGFNEDADALREAVNAALAEMKDDGTYARIYNEWFDKEPPQAVLEATHTPE